MDALTFLRGDHESVLGMLESLERGTPQSRRQQDLYSEMVTSLIIAESQHEAVEEQYFWPAVRRALPEGDELADTAIDQEDRAKVLLQELEQQPVGSDYFQALLTQFISAARAHITFEQEEVWPRFAAAQSPQELEGLGQKMAAAKKLAPTRPHPDTPSDPAALKTAGLMAAAADKVRDMVSGRSRLNPPDPPAP
ncbi:hemerythrin domain-containing protein [Nocardia goodfellowii]